MEIYMPMVMLMLILTLTSANDNVNLTAIADSIENPHAVNLSLYLP